MSTADSVAAVLHSGEYVVPASSFKFLGFLEQEPQLTEAGRALVEAGTPEEWVKSYGGEYTEQQSLNFYSGPLDGLL